MFESRCGQCSFPFLCNLVCLIAPSPFLYFYDDRSMPVNLLIKDFSGSQGFQENWKFCVMSKRTRYKRSGIYCLFPLPNWNGNNTANTDASWIQKLKENNQTGSSPSHPFPWNDEIFSNSKIIPWRGFIIIIYTFTTIQRVAMFSWKRQIWIRWPLIIGWLVWSIV